MTAPAAFTHRPGHTRLHALDVRSKLLLMCAFSLCTLYAAVPGLLTSQVVFAVCLGTIRFPVLRAAKELAFFIVLVGLVFLSRAVSGTGAALWSAYGLTVTRGGLLDGVVVAGRFWLIFQAGLLFCATTRPAQAKGAIEWLLRPVPFLPEKKISVIMGLALGFLPMIFKQYHDIRDARAARCAGNRKNPVRGMIGIAVPLISRTFILAGRRVEALQARCYSADRTDPEFQSSGAQLPWLIAGLGLCSALVLV